MLARAFSWFPACHLRADYAGSTVLAVSLRAAAHAVSQAVERDPVAKQQNAVARHVHRVVQGGVESLDSFLGYATAAQHGENLTFGPQVALLTHGSPLWAGGASRLSRDDRLNRLRRW